jgi:hypothetical protein
VTLRIDAQLIHVITTDGVLARTLHARSRLHGAQTAGLVHGLSPAKIEVGASDQRSLQAGGQGFESPKLHSYQAKRHHREASRRRHTRCVPEQVHTPAGSSDLRA